MLGPIAKKDLSNFNMPSSSMLAHSEQYAAFFIFKYFLHSPTLHIPLALGGTRNSRVFCFYTLNQLTLELQVVVVFS